MFPNIHDGRLSEIAGWYISILDYIYYDQTINSSGIDAEVNGMELG